jgi:hypothetical protein
MTRICSSCKRELSLDQFQTRTDRKDLTRSQCKVCCSHKNKIWRDKNKKRLEVLRKKNYVEYTSEYRKASREWRRKNPLQKLIQGAKERARKFNLPFNLTVSDLIMPETCPVLGIKLEPNIGGKIAAPNSPSLDRINPKLGYVKGNVQIISFRANTIKNCGSLEEHQKVIRYMLDHEISPCG